MTAGMKHGGRFRENNFQSKEFYYRNSQFMASLRMDDGGQAGYGPDTMQGATFQ